MFKECLKYNIIPFIIEDHLKLFYYRGLKEWNDEKVMENSRYYGIMLKRGEHRKHELQQYQDQERAYGT